MIDVWYYSYKTTRAADAIPCNECVALKGEFCVDIHTGFLHRSRVNRFLRSPLSAGLRREDENREIFI